MLMLCSIRELNDHLFGKELFIRFTGRAFVNIFSLGVCFLIFFFKDGMSYSSSFHIFLLFRDMFSFLNNSFEIGARIFTMIISL